MNTNGLAVAAVSDGRSWNFRAGLLVERVVVNALAENAASSRLVFNMAFGE
jgi:hypothetical protein